MPARGPAARPDRSPPGPSPPHGRRLISCSAIALRYATRCAGVSKCSALARSVPMAPEPHQEQQEHRLEDVRRLRADGIATRAGSRTGQPPDQQCALDRTAQGVAVALDQQPDRRGVVLVQASTRSVKLGCDAISACMPRAAVRNHRSHEMDPPMIADATPGDRPDRIMAARNLHGCNQSVEREVEIFSLSTSMKCGRTRPGQKMDASRRTPPARIAAPGPAPTATPSGGDRPGVTRSRSGSRAGRSRCRSRPESPGRSKMLTASRRCSPSEGEHLRREVEHLRSRYRHDACTRRGRIERPRGRPGRVERSGPARAGRASPADRPSAGRPARAEIRVVSLASPGGDTGAGGGVRRDVPEIRFIFPHPAIAV